MKIVYELTVKIAWRNFSHLFHVGSCSSTLVEWNMLHGGWGSYIVLFLCHYWNCLHQHLPVSPGYGSVHLLLPLHLSASEPLLTPHYRPDILHLPSPSMHCTRATGPAPVILGVRALRRDWRRSHIPACRLVLGNPLSSTDLQAFWAQLKWPNGYVMCFMLICGHLQRRFLFDGWCVV